MKKVIYGLVLSLVISTTCYSIEKNIRHVIPSRSAAKRQNQTKIDQKVYAQAARDCAFYTKRNKQYLSIGGERYRKALFKEAQKIRRDLDCSKKFDPPDFLEQGKKLDKILGEGFPDAERILRGKTFWLSAFFSSVLKNQTRNLEKSKIELLYSLYKDGFRL